MPERPGIGSGPVPGDLSQAGMKPRDFYGDILRGLGEEPNFTSLSRN